MSQGRLALHEVLRTDMTNTFTVSDEDRYRMDVQGYLVSEAS